MGPSGCPDRLSARPRRLWGPPPVEEVQKLQRPSRLPLIGARGKLPPLEARSERVADGLAEALGRRLSGGRAAALRVVSGVAELREMKATSGVESSWLGAREQSCISRGPAWRCSSCGSWSAFKALSERRRLRPRSKRRSLAIAPGRLEMLGRRAWEDSLEALGGAFGGA